MSLRVGLTGGLASGKTTVAKMFASRGAYVLYADKVGHELMEPGQPVYEEIIRHFGDSIVNSDKTINRPKLAEIAFGTGRIEELNRIVHPAVAKRLESWAAGKEPKDLNRVDEKHKLKAEPRDVFAYVIHEGKIRAPAGAMALIEKVKG